MKTAHGITGSDTTLSAPSGKGMVQSMLNNKPVFSKPVLRKYENAVVDYVVEGGITLRAAGSARFKKFVVSLTNGYEPPSTRTILRWIADLYRILEPLMAIFLCNLNVASLTTKSILLMILDIKCRTGVGKRVGTALFKYLKRLGRV